MMKQSVRILCHRAVILSSDSVSPFTVNEIAPGFVSWCSNKRVLALLFLASEKTCSSSQVKPELIRIIGMCYMKSISWRIFLSTPCWKQDCLLSFACTQLIHLFFLLQSSKSSCFSPLYFLLAWTISLLKDCCVAASLASKKFESIMFAHWNCWGEIWKDWYI